MKNESKLLLRSYEKPVNTSETVFNSEVKNLFNNITIFKIKVSIMRRNNKDLTYWQIIIIIVLIALFVMSILMMFLGFILVNSKKKLSSYFMTRIFFSINF